MYTSPPFPDPQSVAAFVAAAVVAAGFVAAGFIGALAAVSANTLGPPVAFHCAGADRYSELASLADVLVASLLQPDTLYPYFGHPTGGAICCLRVLHYSRPFTEVFGVFLLDPTSFIPLI